MIENKAILNFNDYNWRELFDSNNFFYYHDTDDTFRYDDSEQFYNFVQDILEPFLKSIYKNRITSSLILKFHNDEDWYYKQTLYYDVDKDEFRVQTIDDDDWENDISYENTFTVRLNNLIHAFNYYKDSFKSLNIESLNYRTRLDINRYSIEYINTILLENDRHYCRISKFNIKEDIFKMIADSNCQYPDLYLSSIYNFLLNKIDDLIDYIYCCMSKILSCKGFKSASGDMFELEYSRTKIENTIENIINEKPICLKNMNKYLHNIVKDIIFNTNNVHTKIDINELFVNEEHEVSEIDEERREIPSIANPLNYKRTVCKTYSNKHKDSCDIILNNQKISLNRDNLAYFKLEVTPKVYAPKETYLIKVNFEFKDNDRLMYLRDFNEEVCVDELIHFDVDITNIRVYKEK